MIGGVSGVLGQLLIYPMEVVKVRLAVSPNGTYTGVWDGKKLYEERKKLTLTQSRGSPNPNPNPHSPNPNPNPNPRSPAQSMGPSQRRFPPALPRSRPVVSGYIPVCGRRYHAV